MNVNITLLTTTTCAARVLDDEAGLEEESGNLADGMKDSLRCAGGEASSRQWRLMNRATARYVAGRPMQPADGHISLQKTATVRGIEFLDRLRG
jgi:hypothetical protein